VNDIERKAVVGAISTLLLADHMGDAHEAGVALAKLLWGDMGADEYADSVENGHATDEMRRLLAVDEPEVWGEP
jgi:hypothetical protein